MSRHWRGTWLQGKKKNKTNNKPNQYKYKIELSMYSLGAGPPTCRDLCHPQSCWAAGWVDAGYQPLSTLCLVFSGSRCLVGQTPGTDTSTVKEEGEGSSLVPNERKGGSALHGGKNKERCHGVGASPAVGLPCVLLEDKIEAKRPDEATGRAEEAAGRAVRSGG